MRNMDYQVRGSCSLNPRMRKILGQVFAPFHSLHLPQEFELLAILFVMRGLGFLQASISSYLVAMDVHKVMSSIQPLQ